MMLDPHRNALDPWPRPPLGLQHYWPGVNCSFVRMCHVVLMQLNCMLCAAHCPGAQMQRLLLLSCGA